MTTGMQGEYWIGEYTKKEYTIYTKKEYTIYTKKEYTNRRIHKERTINHV